MNLSPRERRLVKTASRELDLLPVSAPSVAVFDAIRPCVPAAAGLFSVIRPGAEDALVSQPMRLPPEIFESWLRMPPDLLQMSLAPVISSKPGKLWRDSETLRGAQREQVDVLRELGSAGLGEGAGYKLLERPIPWYGVEHLMLALLMERGESVPARSQEMLTRLHEHIRGALLRLSLPLLSRQPIYEQLVAEQSLGYICLSPGGRVLEANRRAHHLIDRYKTEAHIQGLRGAVESFAARAQQEAVRGQPWLLRSNKLPSILQVDAHRLPKETHTLPEDAVLLSMREVTEPPVTAEAHPALGKLTGRQREVALLLFASEDSRKQLADQLKLSEGTVRSHIAQVYKRLEVQSRLGLIKLLKGRGAHKARS